MKQLVNSKWGELIRTDDGSLTIRHSGIDEEYHSKQGALSESQILYLERSGFMALLKGEELAPELPVLRVLDVGLGLGYNALSTISAWLSNPVRTNLRLTSLEINPDLVAALASRQGPWMEDWSELWLKVAGALVEVDARHWRADISHPIDCNLSCTWHITIGDASEHIVFADQSFDYIWQDPFSPKKNPEMWSESWFKSLLTYSHGSTRLMTYSVARSVRDNLEESGWAWEKINATGSKKHWLTAVPAKK